MIATRIASTVTAIAIVAATITTAQLIAAPPAQAALGCCMIRANFRSEWLRSDDGFKKCKEKNAQLDGDKDKLFKKTGRVWWNIRC